ncbi:MAG: hypothetical protein AAF960_29335 [Bacteroidota bacterium]
MKKIIFTMMVLISCTLNVQAITGPNVFGELQNLMERLPELERSIPPQRYQELILEHDRIVAGYNKEMLEVACKVKNGLGLRKPKNIIKKDDEIRRNITIYENAAQRLYGEIHAEILEISGAKSQELLAELNFDPIKDTIDFLIRLLERLQNFGCYKAAEFYNDARLLDFADLITTTNISPIKWDKLLKECDSDEINRYLQKKSKQP